MKKYSGVQSAVRKLNNAEYIGVLKELILEGKQVPLIIAGSSMAPFLIHQRDTVMLSPVQDPLRRGTVVLYQRPDSSYVLHRIVKARADGRFDIVGDAQTVIERGVAREQIFAQVIAAQRNGIWLHPGDFWWEFFEHPWLGMLGLRPIFMKTAGLMKRNRE